jgi:RimJ/RimL family protein N-acetyltransferase
MAILTTTRLRLEPFTDDHVAGLNAVNGDPEVMRYISGRPETLEDTRAVVERVKRRWREIGYSWWAFVEADGGEVVGSGCVQNLRQDARAEPDLACPLEIGWRLRRDRWGRGLASEAARAMAGFAFEALRANELYAVCNPANAASAQVMQRLGMQHLGLQTWYGKECDTYRMAAAAWRASAGEGPDVA